MEDIKALPTRYSLHLMNTSAKDGNCFEVFLNCPDSCSIDNKHAHTAKLITEGKKRRHQKTISSMCMMYNHDTHSSYSKLFWYTGTANMCQKVCDMYPIHALVSSLNHNITSKIEIQNSLHLVLMSTNWCTVVVGDLR